MNFQDLQDEVSIMLKDASPEIVARIPNAINEALLDVCDRARVPDLLRVSSFTTVVNQAYGPMPVGFDGRLLFFGTPDMEIEVEQGGLLDLMRAYPMLDEAGEVSRVALEGATVWYQGIPTVATTYPVLYLALPTLFSALTDVTPSYIPLHLERRLLCHRAAAILYNLIEDGIEQEKPNTAAETLQAEKAFVEFLEYLARRKKHYAQSVWRI